MRIDAPREHQHALGVDHFHASAGDQIPPDFNNRSVANADIAFGTTNGGDDKTVTNDELSRCWAVTPVHHVNNKTSKTGRARFIVPPVSVCFLR